MDEAAETSEASLLVAAEPAPPRSGRAALVALLGLVSLAAAGAALRPRGPRGTRGAREGSEESEVPCYAASERRLRLPISEVPPGACHVPPGFCRGEDDRLEYHDCDGDNLLDPYCVGAHKLSFGYVSSKSKCSSNWPNGLCLNQDEPSIANAETIIPALTNEITIIHFNDVYEMAGVLEDGMRKGGMSRAAYVIERARKRNPDRTLVVFAGDLLSPSVLSDLFHGRQAVDVLNYLNLTAASLGNHEFDFGVDILQQRMQESKFPWLNINLMDEKGQLLAGTQKHKIIDLPFSPRWSTEPNTKSTRLCIFGAAYDLLHTLYKDKERLSYADAQKASIAEARELREKHQCQVVLALTHQFGKDDCALAKAAGSDIDLILGGHDHFTDLRSDCGHATYLKADSDLKTQWVMTMLLNDKGQSESIEGKLLSLTDSDPFSPSVHDKVITWEKRGQEELGKTIGCSKVALDARESQVRQKETLIGNFLTDAIQDMHKTDVVIIPGGVIRGDKVFAAGNLTKKALTEMHPFGNAIVKVWATGAQLKKYIDSQLSCFAHLCGHFPVVAGLKYRFNSQGLQRLTWSNGTAVRDTDRATLAMTDYCYSRSVFRKDKLFHMGTVNDAVPLVLALYAAVDGRKSCIHPRLEGRMVHS